MKKSGHGIVTLLIFLLVGAPVHASTSTGDSANKPLLNPSSNSSRDLTMSAFQGRYGPSKAVYKRAVKHRDSGYAHDAFMASMAYWHGYNTKGRIHRGKSKGKNKERSLKYLLLASDLGWPEASLVLYTCYGRESADPAWTWELNLASKSYPPGNVDVGYCIHRRMDWDDYSGNHDEFVLGSSPEKARFYLERAAQQAVGMPLGYGGALKYSQSLNGESDDVDAGDRLQMLVTALRFDALRYAARQHVERTGFESFPAIKYARPKALYQEDFSSCAELYDGVLQRAAYEDLMSCQAIASGRDVRYCPGQGYHHVRSFLDACMVLAPDEEQRAHYLKLRMSYAHPFMDSDTFVSRTDDGQSGTFYARAYRYYQARNNDDMVSLVTDAWTKARQKVFSQSKGWDAERARRHAQNVRIADDNRAQEAERERRAAEEWDQLQADLAAADARDRREASQAVASFDDGFMDSLQRQQDQTVLNIYMQQNAYNQVSADAEPVDDPRVDGYPGSATEDTPPEMCPYPRFGEHCTPDDREPGWLARFAEKRKECEARDRERHQEWLASLSPYCRAKHEDGVRKRQEPGGNVQGIAK